MLFRSNILVCVDADLAVLRRPPAGVLPPGSHDMAREHRVLTGLEGRLEFAPRSLHFCDDASVAGAPFQLLRYYAGRPVRGDQLDPLPPTAETGALLSRMLIDTLAAIHAVDVEAAGLGELGKPEGFLTRAARGWIGRARAFKGDQLSGSAAYVASWLSDRNPLACAAPTLLHNDFKLDNVLLRQDAIEPLVVLDWDMATRGDPLSDLATLLSYWTEPGDPDCMHRLAQMPTANAGFMSRAEAAQAYAERTGRGLEGFDYARVLAIFRLAVVFHQLHARYMGEGTTDPVRQGFAALADEIFDFAATVARGERF